MDNAATVRRIYELVNAGDVQGMGALMADDFVEHEDIPGGGTGKEDVIAFFEMQRAAFPDMAMTPEDVIDAGDKVVVRARFTGTHQGDFMGVPATGRSVDVPLIDIMRLGDDGLVHEHWGVFDAMGMMGQLGVLEG
jgi:steroid delta-isomerase-like uncharacterized protein